MEINARAAHEFMTEILIFTLNGIVIYLFSDWIVRTIEQMRGEALKQRQVVFFIIFLTLALVTFQILRRIFAAT
jgi:uncharacterized membrane protein